MLSLTHEQDMLRDSVRRFLADRSPERVVRSLMDSELGFDRAMWRSMAQDLGLQSTVIPAKFGGLGLSYLDLCLIFEEMGRVLLCAPFYSTVALAANLLLCLGDDEASASYLPQIAAGDLTATVAMSDQKLYWDPGDVQLTAKRAGRDWRLTGRKAFVLDGASADVIFVIGRAEGELRCFAVERAAAGFSAEPCATLDATRKLAHLTFSDVAAKMIHNAGDVRTAVQRTIDLATVALAAEQIGGAHRLLEMALDHAKFRVQFGRPIGSFQAIKHMCADLLLEIETAKAAAHESYRAASGDPSRLAVCASTAKAFCSEAYFHASVVNIQIHGGIGFTWENPAHLYFRRAKSSELYLGDADFHRERYLAASGF